MRIVGSLKLSTIHVLELIRSLLKSSRPSGLAQAIMEVGCVNKTRYFLNYIEDEDYRWQILTQLNRGERGHAVARAICYGQRGEIQKALLDLCDCLILICSIQHQMKVNLKKRYKFRLTN